MTMSRQHFQLIANALKSGAYQANLTKEQSEKLITIFANELSATNGMFDRSRFVEASTPENL